LHSSPNVLFLNIEDAVPKDFFIVPRGLLGHESDHMIQDSQTATLLGVDGSGLFALIGKANLFFRKNKIKEIPIRCALAKSEKGYLMMELK
jgi:hypothetical protein